MEADRDPTHAPRATERTVADLLRAWYAHGEASWSASTATGYRSRIRLVSPTLIAAGEDIHLVAGRLGHARAATTLDVYAHLRLCSRP